MQIVLILFIYLLIDKGSLKSPTEPSSPIHKASIAFASAAIADTIQLAAQPVAQGKTKKIAPVDRTFHDIIDAECVFIELADHGSEEIDDAEEGKDMTDGR